MTAFKHSPETIEKMRQARIGDKNPMYGKKHKIESRIKMSGSQLGEKSPQWKGDKVGYYPLHIWIRRRLPQPEFCAMCKKVPPLDLANKTGIYNRDLENWYYLCRSCHMISDGRLERFKTMAKIYKPDRDPMTGQFIPIKR